MTLLDELQALPIGQTRTVPWDELRPYFPGLTEKQRWDAMLAWLRSRNLSYVSDAGDLKVRPDGTFAAVTLTVGRDTPTG